MRFTALFMLGALCITSSMARESEEWGNSDASVREWYKKLMQPDHPRISCCGEADAYWADSFEVEGDHYIAIITDDRPDKPLNRRHIESGTRLSVPNYKVKFDAGNPTGHGVIFIGVQGEIYCYIPPGGV